MTTATRIATRQPYGVWGGLAEDGRRRVVAGARWRPHPHRDRPQGGQR